VDEGAGDERGGQGEPRESGVLRPGSGVGSTSNGVGTKTKDGKGGSPKAPPVRRKIRAQCGLVIEKPDREVVRKSSQPWFCIFNVD
jgi:hypothetical protein